MALLDAGLEPTILATDVSDEARELGAAGVYAGRPGGRSAGALAAAVLPRSGPAGGWRSRASCARRSPSCRSNLARQHPSAGGLGQLRRRRLPERAAVLRAPAGLAHPARAGRDRPRRRLPAAQRRRAPAGLVGALAGLGAIGRRPLAAPPARALRPAPPDAPGRRRSPTTRPRCRPVRPPPSCRRGWPRPRPPPAAGNVDLALALARQATAEFPLEPATHLCLGLLLKGAGRLYEAIAPLRRARFLFGDDSWLAPYSLAVCLEHNGEDPGGAGGLPAGLRHPAGRGQVRAAYCRRQ